jgi:hypothetical protein
MVLDPGGTFVQEVEGRHGRNVATRGPRRFPVTNGTEQGPPTHV